MKTKLKKFNEFSHSLLPHEADYLESKARFSDPEKRQIFSRLLSNARSREQSLNFDTKINKRKYSYIMKWIQKSLESIDVDSDLRSLLSLKEKILTDSISPDEEGYLLSYFSNYQSVAHFFQNHYEIAREYKSYLLIRMRYDDHLIISDFLNRFKVHAQKAGKIHDQLYKATAEITSQYTLQNQETRYWEKYLSKVFMSDGIDGRNRYQAFILLAFLYSNYNQPEKLEAIFDAIDEMFRKGLFYSKRFLFNYYNSRVLMHSRRNELDAATYYGYLSIRLENTDTLMYVNNLSANLLKSQKAADSLKLLQDYENLFEQTHNYHQKTGFISYKIRSLSALNRHDDAIDLGEMYLSKYKNELLQHRWHHFFTSYFNALIHQEEYQKILQVSKKFNLLQIEKERSQKSNYYIPNLSWSISLSKYMEGHIDSSRLLKEIEAPLKGLNPTSHQKIILMQVIDNLSVNLPEAFLKLKSHL